MTRGNVEKVKGDPELVRAYLGGKGLGAKILWDRVPPETDPFSPDNLIIISNGLLVGTTVPFANRAVMTFISPLTDLYYHSAMGGFWAPELKHAGYDNIVIGGKSPTPVYLWINNDQVELRDASHLWGKGTYETRKIIREELENDKIQIACIGPAGENKVNAAGVMCGTGAGCTRAGIGALWGDKNLKAIAVYGTKDVTVANPTKVFELSDHIQERSKKQREMRQKSNSASLRGINRWETRDVWYGNFNEQDCGTLPPDSELKQAIDKIDDKMEDLLTRKGARMMGCYNCMAQCRQAFSREDGSITFLKCSSLLPFLVYSKYFDYDFALDCFNWSEEQGLDILSFPRYVALGIDLYQRGIIGKEDTEGIELEFGNPKIFWWLMEKIVKREGIGDVLANGTLKAARQIGKGAEERVNVAKGLELVLPAPFIYDPIYALTTAVSDKGDLSGNVNTAGSDWTWGSKTSVKLTNRKEREAYIRNGWCLYSKEYEKYFLPDLNHDGTDPEPWVQRYVYENEIFALADSLGLCHFTSGFGRYHPISKRSQMADLVANASGMNASETELTITAERIINLIKAYGLRLGLTRKDDTVPKIYFEETPVAPRFKLTHGILDKWINRYYELRGWDNEGVPTKETLQRSGLDYVRQDLEQRGILKEKEVLTT